MNTLERLAETIASRKETDPEKSWTAHLLSRGPEKCAQKFGEEAIEAVMAVARDDRANLVYESADVLYHLLVMLEAEGVSLAEVMAELERRQGMSGIAEKASRQGDP